MTKRERNKTVIMTAAVFLAGIAIGRLTAEDNKSVTDHHFDLVVSAAPENPGLEIVDDNAGSLEEPSDIQKEQYDAQEASEMQTVDQDAGGYLIENDKHNTDLVETYFPYALDLSETVSAGDLQETAERNAGYTEKPSFVSMTDSAETEITPEEPDNIEEAPEQLPDAEIIAVNPNGDNSTVEESTSVETAAEVDPVNSDSEEFQPDKISSNLTDDTERNPELSETYVNVETDPLTEEDNEDSLKDAESVSDADSGKGRQSELAETDETEQENNPEESDINESLTVEQEENVTEEMSAPGEAEENDEDDHNEDGLPEEEQISESENHTADDVTEPGISDKNHDVDTGAGETLQDVNEESETEETDVPEKTEPPVEENEKTVPEETEPSAREDNDNRLAEIQQLSDGVDEISRNLDQLESGALLLRAGVSGLAKSTDKASDLAREAGAVDVFDKLDDLQKILENLYGTEENGISEVAAMISEAKEKVIAVSNQLDLLRVNLE